MISIIIPAFNAQDSIKETLDSIVNQKVGMPFEILVINDGSFDRTKEVVEQYINDHPAAAVKLFNQKNAGVSAARNKGLSEAAGEIVFFVDADDICLPGYLEELSSGIDEECDFTFSSIRKDFDDGRTQNVNAGDTLSGIQDAETVFTGFLTGKMNVGITVSAHKMSIIRRYGLRFMNIPYAEDQLFSFRYLTFCRKTRILNEVLYCYNCSEERFKAREAEKPDLGKNGSIYELLCEDVQRAGWENGYAVLTEGRIPLDYMNTVLKTAYYAENYSAFKQWLTAGEPSVLKKMSCFRGKSFKIKTRVKAGLVRIGFNVFPHLAFAAAKKLYSRVYYGVK